MKPPHTENGGPDRVDVAVAGAGIVGLAAALAIKRALEARARVTVLDAALARAAAPPRGFRAVAITAGSRRLLERVGVWSAVRAGAEPIRAMDLTDTRPGVLPPPVFLAFGGPVAPNEPFAHMVFHDDLHEALLETCREAGVELRPQGVASFSAGGEESLVRTVAAGLLSTRLLVAADGSRSRLREQAGIMTTGWDYGQSAIVATLAHERDHEGRAQQHFMPGGPLAVLPMRADDGSRRRSSIVWTERRSEAARLAALPDTAFVAELHERLGHRFGALRLEDRPVAHPLRLSLARRLVAPRMALAGDAARTIHPLAGQGLNLGLKDAAALSDAVVDAMRLGLDPGAATVLGGYQRARRADAAVMAVTTDLLNKLFSNDNGPLRLVRDVGLGLVDRAPGLKRLLMREASGDGLLSL